MEAKKCTACGEVKPLAEFYQDHNRSDGLTARCKPCYRAKLAEYQKRSSGLNAAKDGMKRCTLCKETKPVADFTRNKVFGDGLHSACKACASTRNKAYGKANRKRLSADQMQRYYANPERFADYGLKKRFGLKAGTYDNMLAQQDGKCAICGSPSPGGVRLRRFHVDHCHETGRVRGLLCGPCNTGIGQLRHSQPLLLAAIDYLKKYPSNQPNAPVLDAVDSIAATNC